MNLMIKILGSTCKYTDPTFGGSSSQSPRLEGQLAGCKAVRVGSWCTEVPAGGCYYDRPATGSNPAAEVRGNDPSRAACCTQPDPRGLVWGKRHQRTNKKRCVSVCSLRPHRLFGPTEWMASSSRVLTACGRRMFPDEGATDRVAITRRRAPASDSQMRDDNSRAKFPRVLSLCVC